MTSIQDKALKHAEKAENLLDQVKKGTGSVVQTMPVEVAQTLLAGAQVHATLANYWLTAALLESGDE